MISKDSTQTVANALCDSATPERLQALLEWGLWKSKPASITD